LAKTYRVTPTVRILNFLAGTLVRLGLGPASRHLLTVQGRKSGRAYTTTVTVVDQGGRRYLVAPYGEVHWVRNARASPNVTLRRGRVTRLVRLAEVPVTERAAILQAYLQLEPVTQPYFVALPDSPLTAFALESERHPVFLAEDR
jgi:deazaflavin-dependent oxidoreductase (nitroreductase family)